MEQGKRRRRFGIRAAAAAAVVAVGVSGFCITCPAYAKELPVIGDIFLFFEQQGGGVYSNYKTHSTEVGETKEDNGIQVTMNDVLFDGKTLTATYTIRTEQDLGDDLILMDDLTAAGGSSWSGRGGSSAVRKVEDGVYVGQETSTLDDLKTKNDTLEFKWKLSGIQTMGGAQEYPCEISYHAAVEKLEGMTKLLAAHMENADGSIGIDLTQMTRTEANLILDYDVSIAEPYEVMYPDQPGRKSDRRTEVMLQAVDNLGNIYDSEDNGGFQRAGEGVLHRSMTFQLPAEGASELTITALDFRTDQPLAGIEPVKIDLSDLSLK